MKSHRGKIFECSNASLHASFPSYYPFLRSRWPKSFSILPKRTFFAASFTKYKGKNMLLTSYCRTDFVRTVKESEDKKKKLILSHFCCFNSVSIINNYSHVVCNSKRARKTPNSSLFCVMEAKYMSEDMTVTWIPVREQQWRLIESYWDQKNASLTHILQI